MMQSKNPKVSVVCISYNQEKYIRAALDGFVNQRTNFAIEVIIADDASKDGTQAIIKEYAARYPHMFSPILRKKNIGAQKNYIDALQHAKGDYVAECEGDDYWTDETKLQVQVDFLESHSEYALCFHPIRVSFEGGEEEDFLFPTDKQKGHFNLKALLAGNFIQSNSVMYRRQSYDSLPANVMPLDWYTHLYHAQFGKIGFIDKVMGVYRKHQEGVWWDSYKNADNLLKKSWRQQLNLQKELLKIYGQNGEYRQTIYESICNIIVQLARIDREQKEQTLVEVMRVFPDYLEVSIQLLVDRNLQQERDRAKEVEVLDRHSQEQAKIIEHYVHRASVFEEENRQLKGKMLVRLDSAIRGRLPNKKKERQ